MEPYDLTNLAVRLGQLEGTVRTFMDAWARQDTIAHESRRVVYDRIELIGKQVDRVATDVQNIQQDVAELKKEIDEQVMPVIDASEERKHQRVGAKSVWALIGAVTIAAASAMAYIADKVAAYFVPKA
jgi:hypothetical protein